MEEYNNNNTLLIFMRHSERSDLIGLTPEFGPLDPELSKHGVEIAYNAGIFLSEKFKNIFKITNTSSIRIIASPFLRTLQTAREVVKGINSDNYYTLPNKVDVDTHWSEVIYEVFQDNIPKDFLHYFNKTEKFWKEVETLQLQDIATVEDLPNQQESFEDCYVRIAKYLKEFIPTLKERNDKVIIFIGHGEPLNGVNIHLEYPGDKTGDYIRYLDCFTYQVIGDKIQFVNKLSPPK